MKHLLSVCLVILALGSTVACHHTPPNITTQQGKVAYTADQILLRVGELQNVAMQANATGGLPNAQARVVVQFTVDAATILKQTPSGWQATVAALWTTTKAKIVTTNAAVLAAMSALDVVLGSL